MTQHSIYLLRHGEPQWELNKAGQKKKAGPHTSLSENGKLEMEKNAILLQKEGVQLTTIYSSLFQRAYESALIYQKALGGNLILDERLRDINLPVEWGELTSEEIRKLRTEQFPYVQSLDAEVIRNIKNFWKEFQPLLTTPHITGISSHGTPLSYLMLLLTKPEMMDTKESLFPTFDEVDANPAYALKRGEVWKLTFENGIWVEKEKIEADGQEDPPEKM